MPGRKEGKQQQIKLIYFQLATTHLEKVILVHNTAVGQRLDQLISQGGFPTISNSVNKKD